MSVFTKFQKVVLAGIGTFGGAMALYYSFDGNGKDVYASWTTNYSPSVQWDSNWDHRDPSSLVDPKKINDDNKYNESLEKARSKSARHLLLIRHGQYNLSGKTDEDRRLTELGRKQAHYTGLRLQELGLPYTRLISSTMTRANETASIIQKSLPALPICECPLLEEGAPVPPEPPVGNWRPEACQFFQDGARIEAAFRKYFHRAERSQDKDTYDILVCHANVIRYFVCRALQFPPEAWLRLSLHHASITWVTITASGRVILRSYSEAGYMPPDAITSH